MEFTPNGIVTLTTDFGTQDGYVGAMKGVILGIDPRLKIVDIAHQLPPQNLMHAATTLQTAASRFPAGSTHVMVIDPGVGSARAPIALLIQGQLFIGPRNGVLGEIAHQWGGTYQARTIATDGTCAAWLPEDISATFHGRDVFAPIAAAIASQSLSFTDIGPVTDIEHLSRPELIRTAESVTGEVITIDHFGNAITNIRVEDIGDFSHVILPTGTATALKRTYADVREGALLALIGSSGQLEVSVRNGSAAGRLGLTVGTVIQIGKQPASVEPT